MGKKYKVVYDTNNQKYNNSFILKRFNFSGKFFTKKICFIMITFMLCLMIGCSTVDQSSNSQNINDSNQSNEGNDFIQSNEGNDFIQSNESRDIIYPTENPYANLSEEEIHQKYREFTFKPYDAEEYEIISQISDAFVEEGFWLKPNPRDSYSDTYDMDNAKPYVFEINDDVLLIYFLKDEFTETTKEKLFGRWEASSMGFYTTSNNLLFVHMYGEYNPESSTPKIIESIKKIIKNF